MKQAIFTADDFGMSVEINEAVEQAHREGILSTASLMVAGSAVEDAIKRAKKMPSLKVGLHLVTIEGPATLPPEEIPHLVNSDGVFSSEQFKLGINYFFKPAIRSALQAEIIAQFKAYAATGLPLDHANAHKHMHLHPTVGQILIETGKSYGLKAVRVPYEPSRPNYSCKKPSLADNCLQYWTKILRFQIKKAGMHTSDWCFGLAATGQMTTATITTLLDNLPEGLSEIYFHPATAKNAYLTAVMPDYRHHEELEALCSKEIKELLIRKKITPTTWSNLSEKVAH
ncbi:hopanoid biosynthesis-associated protein HpnK [Entomobacter blattae]|uniref:Chitooligosaccharide deacetylase n=1 Tax=Entomobacter blattae TaxID=2762277 RepID=A0A7H1NPZ2_9PROT|nr:hopanoid biosynthesis-associated protein HpnK [Entomobacter blattae]QNT77852.1 Chitooligosaccharide deacetylase [Entomobacter blattae]